MSGYLGWITGEADCDHKVRFALAPKAGAYIVSHRAEVLTTLAIPEREVAGGRNARLAVLTWLCSLHEDTRVLVPRD